MLKSFQRVGSLFFYVMFCRTSIHFLKEFWKTYSDNESCLYKLQVDKIFGVRIKKRVLKYLNDWSLGGNGFHPKTKEITLFFSREFDTEEEWKVWVKEFPWKSGFPKAGILLCHNISKYFVSWESQMPEW